jgi:uncharacterized protein YggE
MKLSYIVVLAAAGVAAAAFIGVGRPEPAHSQSEDVRRVTVTGAGEVETTPDVASFSFGVETRGSTAEDALGANSEEMRRVIAAVREAGVSREDIRTQNVSLAPQRSDDGRTVTGYVATDSVRAEVDELGRSGTVVDAAVGAGANLVYGPSLSREHQDALYRKALQAALDEARGKAEALAEAGGASVGRVLTIAEQGSQQPYAYERMAALTAAPDTTPVEPGKETIHAQVTVTFALQ